MRKLLITAVSLLALSFPVYAGQEEGQAALKDANEFRAEMAHFVEVAKEAEDSSNHRRWQGYNAYAGTASVLAAEAYKKAVENGVHSDAFVKEMTRLQDEVQASVARLTASER